MPSFPKPRPLPRRAAPVDGLAGAGGGVDAGAAIEGAARADPSEPAGGNARAGGSLKTSRQSGRTQRSASIAHAPSSNLPAAPAPTDIAGCDRVPDLVLEGEGLPASALEPAGDVGRCGGSRQVAARRVGD